MSLNMASNVEHTRAYTFVEGKNLLFQDLAVVFLITLPIIGIWNGFHGNVDFRGKPMEKTFSLITQKELNVDTSYLGQRTLIIWALLGKCNCDLGPRSRSPDRMSNP